MGCCGRNRSTQQITNDSPTEVMPTSRTLSAKYFEYVGHTGLTVVGPITGRSYRFSHSGAILAIDERDSPSMVGVPNLRRVPAHE
jgi:hypothetical protein